MRKELFRSGLRAARPVSWHGTVLLLQPVSMRVVTAVLLAFAVGSIIFMSRAQYTRRIVATGIVVPDSGLIKVQSPQAGVILERRVREGQQVHAGDILYVVSAEVMYAPESDNAPYAGSTAAQLRQLQVRQQLLAADKVNTAAIEDREVSELQAKIVSLQAELQQLDQEIALQEERVRAKTAVYERHAQAQGFLSPLGLQQKYDDVLESKTRLLTVQRTRLGLVRDLEAVRTQRETAAQRRALASSERARQQADLRQDQVVREASQRTLVTAPQDGVVAAVLAEPGQRVEHDTMLTIVPRESRLEGQVMLPSSAVGFIREGDPVTVRFDAFPYQRYGAVSGNIHEVSRAALASSESAMGVAASDGFRIRIVLPVQSFAVSGRQFPLRSGMKIEASFTQERHSLLSWLIDPLAVLSQKL